MNTFRKKSIKTMEGLLIPFVVVRTIPATKTNQINTPFAQGKHVQRKLAENAYVFIMVYCWKEYHLFGYPLFGSF
jgi:hypothetical protein